MFRSYLITAFRTLIKFKGFAVINLTGLALGITTGIFILMYVLDELSYDQFHENAARTFRVGTDLADIKTGAINGTLETNGWPIGALLKKDYPEVESVVYLRNGSNMMIQQDGKRFEQCIYYAGEDFFRIFTFPLKAGNPATALSQPNSLVITESMERKYFGNREALGKTLVFADTLSFMITGVMKDIPSQSHMQFDMLISFATYPTINREFSYDDGWGNLNVRNYILLKEGVDQHAFFAKARNLYMDYVKDDMKKYGMFMYVGFEPLYDIYLKSTRGNGMGPSGSIDRVYLVSGIALFVILLACVNFINLATARSAYRAKEVGLRKVVGSSRSLLVGQFLTESFLFSVLSFILAVALVGLLMPLFNQLVGKSYSIVSLLNLPLLIALLFLLATIAILSGFYPAMILSSLRPSEVLKGKLQSSARGVQLRRVLVIFQFLISAVLIMCTWAVQDQLDFMKNRNLGFFGEQVVVLDISKVPGSNPTRSASFKNDLKSFSAVDQATFTNAVPGKPGWVGQWAHATDKPADETIGVEFMTIDEDYLSTLGLTLVAGHNFDSRRSAELEDGLLVNEKTVAQMGWESPEKAIGKKIESPSGYPAGTVIGVVKDYHEFGLQKEIYPMAMAYRPNYSRYFAIKFNATETSSLLSGLQSLWKQHYEGSDFEYFFLDENFERQYQAEQRLGKVFMVFSTMTIIIAVIGLVGLVSFLVVSRAKEIGVRKVLGANIISITGLLSREFLVLVLAANIAAGGISWFLIEQWLQGFAYHTTPQAAGFIWTMVAGIGITIIAVSFQIIKAGMTNPADALRSE